MIQDNEKTDIVMYKKKYTMIINGSSSKFGAGNKGTRQIIEIPNKMRTGSHRKI